MSSIGRMIFFFLIICWSCFATRPVSFGGQLPTGELSTAEGSPSSPGPSTPETPRTIDKPWVARLAPKGPDFIFTVRHLQVEENYIMAVGDVLLSELPKKVAAAVRNMGYNPGEKVDMKVPIGTIVKIETDSVPAMTQVQVISRILDVQPAIFLDPDPLKRPLPGDSLFGHAIFGFDLGDVLFIAGIPKLRRNAVLDLVLWRDRLELRHGATSLLQIPFNRIAAVHMDLKKRDDYILGGRGGYIRNTLVDTVTVDYLNNRGGKSGLVVQMDPFTGILAEQWWALCNVHINIVDSGTFSNKKK
jgi:hypothetical protein